MNEYSGGQWSKREGACASTPATIDVSFCDVDMFGAAIECAVCVLREAALLAVLTLVQCCWCCCGQITVVALLGCPSDINEYADTAVTERTVSWGSPPTFVSNRLWWREKG